jgi:hypothetical protein
MCLGGGFCLFMAGGGGSIQAKDQPIKSGFIVLVYFPDDSIPIDVLEPLVGLFDCDQPGVKDTD